MNIKTKLIIQNINNTKNFLLVSDIQWTENRLGPFAKRDPRYPLPGNMGVVIDKEETIATMTTKSLVDALLEVPSTESHKMEVMGCFLDNMNQEPVEQETKVCSSLSLENVECQQFLINTSLHNCVQN